MSNCGGDEYGGATGGQAGDQTSREWYVRDWYSYPWDYVIRWKDAELGRLCAQLAIEAAENDCIGYDQNERYTFWQNLQRVGYHPKNISVRCEADCSAGVIAIIKAVGYLRGITILQQCSATYTGNMLPWFEGAGAPYFDVLTGKYLSSPYLAKAGDINLNVIHHTNITVDDGDTDTSDTEDNTGTMENVGLCNVRLGMFTAGCKCEQIRSIQKLLRWRGYKGADGKALKCDGELGPNTMYAIAELQRKNGMQNIYYGTVAAATWLLILDGK